LRPAAQAAVASLAGALSPTLPASVLIVTSPARRARQTAAAIAAACGVDEAEIEVDERWREADFGIAEGRTFDELAVLAPDVADALARGETAIDWPDGETAAALSTRVEAAWADLIARSRPAVVVSHAGPIRNALTLARSLPPAAVALLEPATAVRLEIAGESAESVSVLRSLP
jgi:broad specificity phosphatase PhoE